MVMHAALPFSAPFPSCTASPFNFWILLTFHEHTTLTERQQEASNRPSGQQRGGPRNVKAEYIHCSQSNQAGGLVVVELEAHAIVDLVVAQGDVVLQQQATFGCERRGAREPLLPRRMSCPTSRDSMPGHALC